MLIERIGSETSDQSNWQQATSLPHMDGSMVFSRWLQCASPPNTYFLGPTRLQIPNGIAIGSAVFAQLTAECPYILKRAALSPFKIAPSRGGFGLPSNTSFLGPKPKFSTQTASRISIGSVIFVGITYCDRQTDRPTDHSTRSVTIGRIYVQCT